MDCSNLHPLFLKFSLEFFMHRTRRMRGTARAPCSPCPNSAACWAASLSPTSSTCCPTSSSASATPTSTCARPPTTAPRRSCLSCPPTASNWSCPACWPPWRRTSGAPKPAPWNCWGPWPSVLRNSSPAACPPLCQSWSRCWGTRIKRSRTPAHRRSNRSAVSSGGWRIHLVVVVVVVILGLELYLGDVFFMYGVQRSGVFFILI